MSCRIFFAFSCFLFFISTALTLLEVEYLKPKFLDFVQLHEKVYSSDKEHNYRFNVFINNLKKAELLQTESQGTAKYGVTQFSDLTDKEFKKHLLGLSLKTSNQKNFKTAKIPKIRLPKHFDWRKKHVVTQIKNQDLCASCWAFATTGNIESLYAIKHKKLISLSEQELLDCDKIDQGCKGGLMTDAYKAIMEIGGLQTEQSYPYYEKNMTCKFNKTKSAVSIKGAVIIPSNEKKMAKWLVKKGPIAVGINSVGLKFYQEGIASPNSTICDPKKVDHALLLVGYGVKDKIPFWILKNSWGSKWGENGYYRLHRGINACGINVMPSSAIL